MGKPHSHARDDVRIELERCREGMRNRAHTSHDRPAQIFAESVADQVGEVRGRLPSEDSVKRSLRYHRRDPPSPQALDDLELPEEWRHSGGANPEPFLIYDNGPLAESRILAFATEQGLRQLAASDTLFMDGNFDMAPPLFTQIYTIRVPFKDITTTSVYAIIKGKRRDTYTELFDAIIGSCAQYNLDLNIRYIVTDFEDAVLRASSSSFGPNVINRGCFYHLTQSTYRKVQSLGLTQHYLEDEDFRHFCGMMDGLAFLPFDEVHDGMAYLRTVVPDEGADLLDYFDKTYVSGSYRMLPGGDGQPMRLRRTPPLFPPELWNVHEQTLNGDARTNNTCEGWNNKFSNLVGYKHPTVWKTIAWFQKENATVETIIEQDALGQPPKKRKKTEFVRLQQRLQSLCTDRVTGAKDIPAFLHGIGHNIRLTRVV